MADCKDNYIEIDGQKLQHPDEIKNWSEDMRSWPNITLQEITIYLIESKAVDGQAMRNYKSMDSYNYFQSGWVDTVYYHELIGTEFVYMKANVRPSQAIHNEQHKAWVLCKKSGEIMSGGCLCMAGLGQSCSHIGAIMWKVQYAVSKNWTGAACTDQPQTWNKGTSRNVTPSALIDTLKAGKLRKGAPITNHEHTPAKPKFPKYQRHEDYLTAIENSEIKDLFHIKNSTMQASVSVVLDVEKDTLAQHGTHTSEDISTCQLCFAFYQQYIELNSTKRDLLTSCTESQSDSEIWKDSRKIRITCSTAKSVPKKDTTNPDKFIREHLYPKFKGNGVTQQGLIKEPVARQCYASVTHQDIILKGTIVSEDQEWLSASPDGIVGGQKLLEIKCPDTTVLENLISSGTYDVKRSADGVLYLDPKGSRGYYGQIQLSMFVLNLKEADLFVYVSDQDYRIVPVQYDTIYVHANVKRLRHFYFTKMLPRIVDDFNGHRLSICLGYQNIVH
jgi:hypothetical protein